MVCAQAIPDMQAHDEQEKLFDPVALQDISVVESCNTLPAAPSVHIVLVVPGPLLTTVHLLGVEV